jgi:hypothetical protein
MRAFEDGARSAEHAAQNLFFADDMVSDIAV